MVKVYRNKYFEHIIFLVALHVDVDTCEKKFIWKNTWMRTWMSTWMSTGVYDSSEYEVVRIGVSTRSCFLIVRHVCVDTCEGYANECVLYMNEYSYEFRGIWLKYILRWSRMSISIRIDTRWWRTHRIKPTDISGYISENLLKTLSSFKYMGWL